MFVMLQSFFTHFVVLIFTDIFVFDNSYSRLHSKEVEYVVEVLDPHEFSQDKVNKPTRIIQCHTVQYSQ